MKKLFIAIVILLMSNVAMYAGPTVSIWIQIGKKSDNCSGFAFCNWGGGVRSLSTSNSTVQIDENKNTLIVNLTKEAIAGKENYFTGQSVQFEEAFIVPLDIQKSLGSMNKITIAVGKYQFIRTTTGYQIIIPLN